MASPTDTRAPAILIVEDDWLIAEATKRLVERHGFRALPPVASVAAAMRVLDGATPDGVLLDTTLGREQSFPVADRLIEAHVPFTFLTGYQVEQLPPRFQRCRILAKPFSEEALESGLQTMLRA